MIYSPVIEWHVNYKTRGKVFISCVFVRGPEKKPIVLLHIYMVQLLRVM
jgi:hypothetical protein